MRPNILEMSRTAPLPYLLITVQAIVLQKVSLSDMQNLSKSIFKKKMTLIAEVIPKLQTPKNMVTSMSKKSRFKGSFAQQHGKGAQSSLKFAWQHLCHIYWSLWMQLTCKKYLLVTCKISRLFPNTLSADGDFSLFKRDNLTLPI